MKSKIKFLLMALLMGVAVSLSAQDKSMSSAEDMAKKETERMTKELSLNADQQKKIQDINLKYAKKMKDLKSKKSESTMTEQERTKFKEDMKKDMEAKEAEYKKVLSSTQYDTYLKKKGEMKNDKMKKK